MIDLQLKHFRLFLLLFSISFKDLLPSEILSSQISHIKLKVGYMGTAYSSSQVHGLRTLQFHGSGRTPSSDIPSHRTWSFWVFWHREFPRLQMTYSSAYNFELPISGQLTSSFVTISTTWRQIKWAWNGRHRIANSCTYRKGKNFSVCGK